MKAGTRRLRYNKLYTHRKQISRNNNGHMKTGVTMLHIIPHMIRRRLRLYKIMTVPRRSGIIKIITKNKKIIKPNHENLLNTRT
jgi:hypothetical protein